MQQLRLVVPGAVLLCCLTACPKPGGGGGSDGGVNRCQVDLAATGSFAQGGSGASARVIDAEAQLFGGEAAQGSLGDVLLQNDKVRFVIEKPGRSVGPILSGGSIIDADVVRPAGQAGRDAFGRMGFFYAFGRYASATDVEVLADGSNGGPAIVATTGKDAQHDLFNLKTLLRSQVGLEVSFVVDPDRPLNLRTTTYYVLSPGESRVRMLTAFCNDGDAPAVMPLIELMDIGAFEVFNPGGCQNGLGTTKLDPNNSCLVDASKWIASQGDGVAYGLRTMSTTDLTKPTEGNGMLGYGGVVGAFIEADSLDGVLKWTDPEARTRPGNFTVRPGQSRLYLRDFYVAQDIGGIHGAILANDGVATGTLEVSTGTPSARVAVKDAAGTLVTLLVADDAGVARGTLAPGSYSVSAATLSRLPGAAVSATIAAGTTTTVSATPADGRTLSVTVRDPAGQPSPAKVTVFCQGGCPFNADSWKQHASRDYPGMGAAAIDYVPVSGQLALTLPPGEYRVVVSRGPEFSTWPDTWPASGHAVDLRSGDATVTATIGRIIDTAGWLSADLHVHAVSSPDSAVRNEVRAANFLAEGVDVLVSTDHEGITDFAPAVRAIGAEHLMATMIGSEITTFTHGHFNAFPLVRDASRANGGAFDHAGGDDGPSLRMPQFFSGVKAAHPGALVQLNHPRGGGGVLSLLRVDTATLKSRGDPANFGMAPAPDATADDTKLFGDGFDIVESANGPGLRFDVLNDWMTFLSRGTVRTASGVSDTHRLQSDTGGYARTWAKVANDDIRTFQPAAFAEALRTQRAFVSNGPIIQVTARKASGGPAVGMGETLSVTAGEDIEVTVDVQGHEWMQLDRIELYSHAPGREAIDGESNGTWPEGRIFAVKTLDPLALPVEAVPGTTLRRVHVTETFTVQATADTWLVAMARSTGGRTMRPLHSSLPMAYSNAILIDADGSGAYDDFPLKPGQPLSAAPRQAAPLRHGPLSPAEARRFIVKMLEHDHE
jgi:hypothetical protein